MRDSQELHPTIVRDIISISEGGTISDFLDIMQKGADFSKEIANANRNQGSIMKRASNLVLVFPVLVSTSLKVETAVLVSKSIEKKCVSILQLLFSSININSNNTFDLIKKVHTNIGSSGNTVTIDDFMTAMNMLAARNEFTITDKDAYDMVMKEMADINSIAKDYFRESSVNDYEVHTTMFGNTSVTLETDFSSTSGFDVKDAPGFYKAQIISNDYNKPNELTPTLMMVNFVSAGPGNQAINRTGIVGVKAKLYPVDHMEIIERLSKKYSEGGTFFNLMRCSTKEKSFFKDFALAIDRAKLDVLNIHKGSVNTRLFRLLEKRARSTKHKLLRAGNADPITTLVISQEEVEYLKKYFGIDMEKISTAKTIFNGYNLMGLVIVDDSIEVARFLYDDNEGMFESITYDSLAKEDKNGDYKKIVNLMARMNR